MDIRLTQSWCAPHGSVPVHKGVDVQLQCPIILGCVLSVSVVHPLIIQQLSGENVVLRAQPMSQNLQRKSRAAHFI